MEKSLNVLITIITLSSLSVMEIVKTWDLSNTIGLNISEIPIRHVTLIKNKAYLCIPRIKHDQKVTLVEAPWTESLQRDFPRAIIPKAFPKEQLQSINNCSSIQSAISSDTDTLGRLYVLDIGFGNCPPKVIIYDTNNRKKTVICELTDVNSSNLQSIIVDHLSIGGPRAYIGVTSYEGLIIYCSRENRWWFVKLFPPNEYFDGNQTTRRIEPQQLALSRSKPILYITSNNTDSLLSINAAVLRVLPVPSNHMCNSIRSSDTIIDVKLEGDKIGPSKGLVCDLKGGLYYYIPRDYVLVRWDTHRTIRAESHDVLLQSATILPQVEQIFIDLQSQIWVLLGIPNKEGYHCIKIPKSNSL